jgi:hypothetical protein
MSADLAIASRAAQPRMGAFEAWVELHVRPGAFFAGAGRHVPVMVPILLVGMSSVIDRLDSQIMLAELGGRRVSPRFTDWWSYWAAVVGGGCLAGPIAWFVQGWWVRTRAAWCGASHANRSLCRRISTLTSCIAALPVLVSTLIGTAILESPLQSVDHVSGVTVLLLGVLGWSIYASFRAVTSNLAVSRRAAIFWFGILPAGFYGVILLGTTTAYWLGWARAAG